MAVNCWVAPVVMLGVAGVTLMDSSDAATTVKVVLPDWVPRVAVIVLVPAPTALASPFEPVALLTVATALAEEVHVTAVVRFWVELSSRCPWP